MDSTQLALAIGLARSASYLGLLLTMVGLASGLVRGFAGWPLYLIVGGVLGFLLSLVVSVQFRNRLNARESALKRG